MFLVWSVLSVFLFLFVRLSLFFVFLFYSHFLYLCSMFLLLLSLSMFMTSFYLCSRHLSVHFFSLSMFIFFSLPVFTPSLCSCPLSMYVHAIYFSVDVYVFWFDLIQFCSIRYSTGPPFLSTRFQLRYQSLKDASYHKFISFVSLFLSAFLSRNLMYLSSLTCCVLLHSQERFKSDRTFKRLGNFCHASNSKLKQKWPHWRQKNCFQSRAEHFNLIYWLGRCRKIILEHSS